MRVATNARVSTESQEARGTIGSQLELLRRRMSELGHEMVHQYKDDGYSGARLDRPGLDALRDAPRPVSSSRSGVSRRTAWRAATSTRS